MSVEAMKWAWEQNVPQGQKLVLLCLGDRYNKKRGYAWPGYADISKRTGMSVRSVQRHLTELEDAGYIARKKRVSNFGRKLGYTYTFPHFNYLDSETEALEEYWETGAFKTKYIDAHLAMLNPDYEPQDAGGDW